MKKRPKSETAQKVNPEWTAAMFRKARPAREVLPELFGKAQATKLLRQRGRPLVGPPKTAISLRVPNDALARWKATGPGWQTRMAETLVKAL